MVIYEVNIDINDKIYNDYMFWLKHHLTEMLTIDGFKIAKTLQDKSKTDNNIKKITVHYYVESQQKLNNYFDNQALNMRKQTKDTFGGNISISRRTLTLIEEIDVI